ncbi:MAG: type II toxin-antitoxin system YafQ family toxin [Erysipelotrichaceae bacterium]
MEIKTSSVFKKDVEVCKSRGYDLTRLTEVITRLSKKIKLESRYKDHKLQGDFADCHDCHIAPDWLLIYRINRNVLYLIRTGTHSDLL